MTKSELRHARKMAVKNGEKLIGVLAIKSNSVASHRTVNRRNTRKRAKARHVTTDSK